MARMNLQLGPLIFYMTQYLYQITSYCPSLPTPRHLVKAPMSLFKILVKSPRVYRQR